MFKFFSKIESKIVNVLSNTANKLGIETDKFAHFVCTFVITLIVNIIFNINVAVITTSILSVAKEIYDMFKPNKSGFSWEDIEFDIYGMFLAILLVAIF